tara:strand:- start:296 stop:973 length:678 start_codon:yes stop_codon:yes gene_type:complete
MLALRQALSLGKKVEEVAGSWSPTDEGSLEAWYKKGAGVTVVDGAVSQWSDSSEHGRDMVQETTEEKPTYADGILSFDSDNTQNLQTEGQITLSEDFVIGFKANPNETNVVILADNTTSNESIKYSTDSRIVIKIGGNAKNLNLDSGSFGDDYIVISRVDDNITLYKDGELQSGDQDLSGDCLIDAIGVRSVDLNPYDGTAEEVQIYSSSNATLIANVNTSLADL